MKHILLIGAGFSRNWGGWLADEVIEYLLGARGIRNDPELRAILLRHRDTGGFEAALAQVQREFLHLRSEQTTGRFHRLQEAISEMFDTMDRAFSERPFEFQRKIPLLVRTFLMRFDVIFGLNQDYLLERLYQDDNFQRDSGGSWQGWELPGMNPVPDLRASVMIRRFCGRLIQTTSGLLKVTSRISS